MTWFDIKEGVLIFQVGIALFEPAEFALPLIARIASRYLSLRFFGNYFYKRYIVADERKAVSLHKALN